MRDIKLVDGSPLGGSSFELVITTAYGNLNGVMHGGAAGVIFDMCTTMALTPLAKPGFWEYVLVPPPPNFPNSHLLPTIRTMAENEMRNWYPR